MTAIAQQLTRRPISEHCHAVGKQKLYLRLYDEGSGFLCERELVEADGTGVIQAFPFRTLGEVHEFLISDPHYISIRKGVNKIFEILTSGVSHEITSIKTY